MNKQQMAKLSKQQMLELEKARHVKEIYSINELCAMFNCSRYSIDNAINIGKLDYISPNNRDRYIFLPDFLAYMKEQQQGGK